jgi:hypothetical protein
MGDISRLRAIDRGVCTDHTATGANSNTGTNAAAR